MHRHGMSTPVRKHAPITRRYVSVDDAAITYGVSTRFIRRRIADGTITGYKIGTLLRVDPEELEEKMVKRAPWGAA
jgi:excisionase family DNA binding protein